MSFLNLRNSVALFVFLFSLQLSTLPISGRNLVKIQRVTRNDPTSLDVYQQPDFQADDVIATTSESIVPKNEEILTVVEQETIDVSSTDSAPIIQDEEINPFILVASDGINVDNEPVPNVEIVTPSFLNMDEVAGSEPTVKIEDPSVDIRIVAEPEHNKLENYSPTAVSEAQLSPDLAPADPAVIAPENLPVVEDSVDVSAPVSDQSEPILKLEDPSIINPLAGDVPISEDPSTDPVEVVVVPISDEAAAPIPEDPFINHEDVSVPISDEIEPAQKVEDPSVDPLIVTAPISEEAIVPIAEDPFTDPVDVIVVPISDGEVEPAQKLEDPSVDPAIVAAVPISDEAAPIIEDPAADPVAVSAPISDVEVTQKLEDPLLPSIALEDSAVKVPTEETAVPSVAQDLPPSPVFISSVSPATLPIIIATLAPLELVSPSTSPVGAEKVVAVNPKVKTTSNTYPVAGQPKVKQQSTVYNKPAAARPASPAKVQVQYKYQPILISSSPRPAYGPPRTSTSPQSSNGLSSIFPTRPFGSSPKPRQLGFPPISSTRDNVLLEVNWDGKLGRPYRQAKLQ